MPSTPTSGLRLELMTTGENSNTWGSKTNVNLQLLENAITKRQAVAVSSTDVTLTASNFADDQSRSLTLAVSGTLTANVNVIVPALSHFYLVTNDTTGAFSVTVKTPAGTGVVLTRGELNAIYCDATNVLSLKGYLQGSTARTAAEIAAAVIPTDLAYPEGDVRRYGAVGDSSDETARIQNALNVGMQGVTVRFPKNKTYVVGQMNVKAGMRIVGEGATSVLKLKATSASFTRTFTTEANLHNSSSDSEILEIDGLCFDGNRLNQGAYTAFEREQQHSIFLAGNNVLAGRLRTRISNCFFRDTCGDGISIYYNTDTVIENCFFEDCFRSSIAVTGGYSKQRIYGCRGIGATHDSIMQTEIDGAGFNGQKTNELLMSNCDWAGGMDFASDGGTTIELVNVIYRGTLCVINLDGNLTGVKSTFNAVNCTFRIGDTANSRLFRYGITRFTNCLFEWTNNVSHTDFIQPSVLTNQSITFDQCTYRGDATYHTTATVGISSVTWAAGLLTINTSAVHGVAANDSIEIAGVTTDINGLYQVNDVTDSDTYRIPFARDPGAVTVGAGTHRKRSNLNALSMSADTSLNMNQINVFDCRFDASIDRCFAMKQGGWLAMRGNHIEGGIMYDAGAAATFLFYVRIGQYTYGAKHRQLGHVTGSVAGCTLIHEQTFIPVDRSGYTVSGNMTSLTVLGNRYIFGTGAPLTTDPSMLGDIYRRTAPTASTSQQYCALNSAWGTVSATWKAETTLAA